MKIIDKSYLFTFLLCSFFCYVLPGQNHSPGNVSKQFSDTWTAVDALGRSLPFNHQPDSLKNGKYVGIFYFPWLGAHGYDNHTKPLPDEGVQPKLPSDTLSPHDIRKILKRNPDNPIYGPECQIHLQIHTNWKIKFEILIRRAFKMTVYSDMVEEYAKRHNPIWPELKTVLKANGVHNYSIFLDEETNTLFAYVELESEELWQSIANEKICKSWWKHMAELMETNEDDSPVSENLKEVFHID